MPALKYKICDILKIGSDLFLATAVQQGRLYGDEQQMDRPFATRAGSIKKRETLRDLPTSNALHLTSQTAQSFLSTIVLIW